MSQDPFTQSEISTFNDCPIKHDLAYNQLLKPKYTDLALHLGNVMHVWLEHYYKGENFSLSAIYNKLSENVLLSQEDAVESQKTYMAMESLMEVYPQFDPVKKFKLRVVKVEHTCKIPDPNVPARYGSGKVDLICLDASDRIWIMDHKSCSRIDRNLAESFKSNTQMQQYLMAARLDRDIRVLGKKIGGVIPNMIRKPALRQKEKESEKDFLLRVKKDILERPAEYFYSDMLAYEEDVNRRYEQMIFDKVKLMRMPPEVYRKKLGIDKLLPNSNSCKSLFGRCPFYAICYKEPGGESYFTKKRARHEELIREELPCLSAMKPTELVEEVPATPKAVGLTSLVKNLRRKKK